MNASAARDLLDYIERSPSPFHAVQESARRLEDAGFKRLYEADAWQLAPGDRFYVVRDGSTIAAFELGTQAPEDAGFRLIGSHTDSPTLRVKPQPELVRESYRQLAVEVYGGALYSTWLDRDLSIAGRVVLKGAQGIESQLVNLSELVLRIPNLAIHLNRGVNDSLALNAQQHLVPLMGLGDRAGFSFREVLSRALDKQGVRVAPDAVLGWDLSLYALEPPRFAGLNEEFMLAPRLDNLAGCHGALNGLLRASGASRAATRGVVLFDHEEVGSQSARGAGSLLIRALLMRILEAYGPASETRLTRAVARSFLVSSDMAHGVHPNYADRHEPNHRPLLGQGPVIKSNSNQGYSTDGETWALFELLAQQAEAPVQRFVVRSDLGCGSTIGPISAARLGIRTVDVGNPMLSMHSAREMAATADVEPMAKVLTAFMAS
jgi:aspartyl aminopeptidase